MRTNHLFISLIALLAVLMSSCSEQQAGVEVNGAQAFTFSLTTDGQAQTRIAAPTVTGYKLKYFLQVLGADGSAIASASQENTTGTFNVKLPAGVVYTCLFWAHYILDAGTTPNEYFDVTSLKAVALQKHLTGDDQCQAFCAHTAIAADATGGNQTITLKRAVAQVNIKTNAQMKNYTKLMASYSQVPNTFNVVDNKVAATGSVTDPSGFTVTDFNSVSAGADSKFTYQSAYFLASADGVGSMLKIAINTFNSTSSTTPIQTLTIANVPTKKNFKTNVVTDFDPANMTHAYIFDFEEWGTDDNTVSVWDGVVPTGNPTGSTFSGGTGADADHPFLISSAANIAQLAADVSAGYSYAGKFFKLTIDIDLNNKEWAPVGIFISNESPDNKPFSGTLDGGHHKVMQLTVNSSAENATIGLFGFVRSGTIQNLHVSGNVSSTHATGTNNAGGIVGYIYAGQIKGCSFAGSVSNNSNAGNAAGICGTTGGTTTEILGCINRGTITAGRNAGGITDWCQYEIKACYNEGTITGANVAAGIASGMTGATGNVSGCYNIGTITGTAATKEAIALRGGDGTGITDSYSKSKMTTSHAGELEFASGAWPVSTDGTVWYANESNDGSTNKYWKSIGNWNSGTPVYPKLWWEE